MIPHAPLVTRVIASPITLARSVRAIANHAPLTSFAVFVTRVGTWTTMLARCVLRIVKQTCAPRLAGALLVNRDFT
jgi:hypothetical protein